VRHYDAEGQWVGTSYGDLDAISGGPLLEGRDESSADDDGLDEDDDPEDDEVDDSEDDSDDDGDDGDAAD
jgi:hypothetical protein